MFNPSDPQTSGFISAAFLHSTRCSDPEYGCLSVIPSEERTVSRSTKHGETRSYSSTSVVETLQVDVLPDATSSARYEAHAPDDKSVLSSYVSRVLQNPCVLTQSTSRKVRRHSLGHLLNVVDGKSQNSSHAN